MINVAQTLDAIETDGGSGFLMRDPISYRRGVQPIESQPNLDTGAPSIHTMPVAVSNPDDGGAKLISMKIDPPQTPAPAQDALNDPNAWQKIAGSFGPSMDVLDKVNASAGQGGANMMLGPQFGFAPAESTTTSSGANPLVFIIAIAIVGLLAYLHFRKKHHEGAAA